MTDDIAASVKKCQLLLISLTQADKEFRGTINEVGFNPARYLNVGARGVVSAPDVFDYDKLIKYRKLFYQIIEPLRYLNKAFINEYMQILNYNSPFFTQLQSIAHPEAAFILMTTIVVLNLAHKINLGDHEPFRREINAYGDGNDGDSYHRFAENINNYFALNNAISEQELAAQMRQILQGSIIEDENLAFLPCLTAAWFVSEAARNPMTTLTSLILLDLIESRQEFNLNDKNWYTWKHVLINPEKSYGAKKITTAMGKKVNIDDFGVCHPMAHSGSFA